MEKTLFIAHDQVLDGVTLEEVMDALGVIKCLSLQGKQKVSIIEDISKLAEERVRLRGKVYSGMNSNVFDYLYELPIMALNTLYATTKELVALDKIAGQVDPSGPIQGQDF